MKIILSEDGIHLPDVQVMEYVQRKIKTGDHLHTSQDLMILCARAVLHEIPVEERPEVEWIFYGKTVHFDKDLKSFDAWGDPRLQIGEDALMILL